MTITIGNLKLKTTFLLHLLLLFISLGGGGGASIIINIVILCLEHSTKWIWRFINHINYYLLFIVIFSSTNIRLIYLFKIPKANVLDSSFLRLGFFGDVINHLTMNWQFIGIIYTYINFFYIIILPQFSYCAKLYCISFVMRILTMLILYLHVI